MFAARILIAEDESIVARDIKTRLIRLGYPQPIICFTGEDAVDQARLAKPDLVLMDIILSRGMMDGIEAAQQIQSFMNVPIIYLTASNDEATLTRAKATKPAGFILKPFETPELRDTIAAVLTKHNL
ncbi:MAG: response regulator [Spirochaetia bacterium]|nr:response regulator [Spirochaetia bacterium]